MIFVTEKTILKGMKLSDLLLMVGAFALSAWIAHYEIDQVPLEELVTMRMKAQNFILFMSIGWVWLWVFSSFGLYQTSRFLKQKYRSCSVLKATTAGTLIILIDSYLFEIDLITPLFICLFWVVSSVLGISSRILFRSLFNKFWSDANTDLNDRIRSKKAFMQIIEKERIRADRDNHNCSIVLFSIDFNEQHDDALSILIKTICGRVRRIDEVGWYDNYRVGVILPYTSMQGAGKFAEYICTSMENVSKKTSCEVYTYPFDRRSLIQDKSTKRLSAAEVMTNPNEIL